MYLQRLWGQHHAWFLQRPHEMLVVIHCYFYLFIYLVVPSLSCWHRKSLILRRRRWHPTPALLLGKSHGRRSLVGCSPWGCWESDMTEWLHFHFSLSCIGEGHGNPLRCSCLENPGDGAAWWAAVYGVTQSRTRLKRLSSSILYTMIFIFSPYVRVYSFRYLMNKVLDKFLESGNHASSPRNLQIEVAILGCRRSIHAIRYTECPL